MKQYYLLILFALFFQGFAAAQEEEEYIDEEEEPTEEEYVPRYELGADVNFSATNFGGSWGLGLKFGFLKNERFIFGPSARFQRSWSNDANYTAAKFGYSVYGGGGFFHVRLADYFFVGTEVEFLATPIQGGFLTNSKNIVPTALIGGGFSRAFSPHFRLNAGIMYDVVDDPDSPFRQGYFLRRNNGSWIPVMYRIAFFFPL